jgi:drug/metabolite transporter (DMT)-like permease
MIAAFTARDLDSNQDTPIRRRNDGSARIGWQDAIFRGTLRAVRSHFADPARCPMNFASLFRLFALAAIWGASFLFMRIAVPTLGPVLLIAQRVLLAALVLVAIALATHRYRELIGHWRVHFTVGAFNTAIPFVLIAWAAQTLSVSLLAILNATAPIFGAIFTAVWLRQRPTPRVVAGLVAGLSGVAVLVGFDAEVLAQGGLPAVCAGLAAAACYGIATTYLKARAPAITSFTVAHGSMWAATLLLAPLVPLFPQPAPDSPTVVGAVILLGVLCTGIAYLLYFRLVADLGPTRALTVTFLIPVFGVLWGHLVLGEEVGLRTFVGAAIVLAGTALATGFSPLRVFARSSPAP